MNAIDIATVITVYPAFPEDIKEREVRRIVRLLNASPDTKKFGGSEEDIYELEVGGRVYRAYCTRANTPQEARS